MVSLSLSTSVAGTNTDWRLLVFPSDWDGVADSASPVVVTLEPFEMWASIVLTTTLTAPEPCTATAPAPVPPAATAVTTASDVAVTSTNRVAETAELSM